MKTIMLAAAAVVSLGIGSAYAGDGDGPSADTFFTELPGVVAQPSVQKPASALASNSQGAHINTYVTNRSTGTWLFPPNQNQGSNS